MALLSNHMVGSHKIVLLIDDIGVGGYGCKLLDKLLLEQNVAYEKFDGHHEFPNRISIVATISKLELEHGQPAAIRSIQKLKSNPNVAQIFCWATSKNIKSRLMIPFLEHMSNLVVHINSNKLLSILTKRKFGSVKYKVYQHDLIMGNTSIKEYKEPVTKAKEEEPVVNPESIGTFKIGEFTSSELEAKKNMKLPYELM